MQPAKKGHFEGSLGIIQGSRLYTEYMGIYRKLFSPKQTWNRTKAAYKDSCTAKDGFTVFRVCLREGTASGFGISRFEIPVAENSHLDVENSQDLNKPPNRPNSN